jgi:hypothetical protein
MALSARPPAPNSDWGDLVHRLCANLGRRGAVLLTLAVLDIVYAIGLFLPASGPHRSASTTFLSGILPLPVWAILWLIVGGLLAIGSFQLRDRWAYALAVGLKTLWGTVTLLGWVVTGVERGWLSAAIWLAFAVVILVISAWPEPPEDLFAKED